VKSLRGQAGVEFAFIAPVAMIVLLIAVQLAVIGRDAVYLGQLTYQATRWASSQNPSAQCSDVTTYMTSTASPAIQAIISKSGIACGDSTKGVNVTLSCPLTPSACTAGTTRPFGTQVQITVALNVANDTFLPNPFLGIPLPQTLNSTQTAFTNS